MDTPHPLVQFLSPARRKPRKAEEDRRTVRIPVLVTPPEKELLQAMAADRGCSISTIMRAAIEAIPATRLDQEGIIELHKLTAHLVLLTQELDKGFADPDEILQIILDVQELYRLILEELTE